MNVLVTGGAGYVGTSLINKLAHEQKIEKIVIYDNLSRPNFNLFLGSRFANSSKIHFVKGELLDSRNLKKALKDIDVVLHLAAKVTTPFANVDAHLYEQVNHWGTAELVYAVEESKVKHFVYMSSSGIYGSSESAVSETIEPKPQTFYAISKLRGEEHVRRLIPKIRTHILRCGNVYGYNQSMRFDAVINKFIFEANFEKRITVHGDGNQSRAFIHIDSVAVALTNLILTEVESGTYNLVERNVKIIDIVDELKQLLPDLEFIFINQHLKLNQLSVTVNHEFNNKLAMPEVRPLKDQLQEFISKFSF